MPIQILALNPTTICLPSTSQFSNFQLNDATHFTGNVPNTHGGIKLSNPVI